MTVLTLIISILTIGLYFWYVKHWKIIRDLWKIPGPPHFPIIGSLSFIWTAREDLFRNERKLALQFYPIFRRKLFHKGIITLLCPEDIEMVLTSTAHLQKSRVYSALHCWLGTGLLTSYGSKWKTRRKMLTPAFHFSILHNFVKIFNEANLRLVEDLKQNQNKSYIDVLPPITEFTLNSIIETSMGIKLNSTDNGKNYKKSVYDFGTILMYRVTRPWLLLDSLFRFTSAFYDNKKLVKSLHEFSKRVIDERKLSFDREQSYTTKRMAMLDLLLAAKEEGTNIDDEGIREEVDTFIFEGHDTTSAAICCVLLLLANNPDIQNGIYEEILETIGDNPAVVPTYSDLQKLQFTERCLKESLRLYPSVPIITRVAAHNFFTTTGYKIPKGSIIHMPIYDLHHNPNLYPDPEKFDPDRFLPDNIRERHPFAYIPFSAGPRNCIGQKFAMLELKAVLCGILRHFTLEAVDKEEDVIFVTDLVLRSKNGIRVKFVARTI